MNAHRIWEKRRKKTEKGKPQSLIFCSIVYLTLLQCFIPFLGCILPSYVRTFVLKIGIEKFKRNQEKNGLKSEHF